VTVPVPPQASGGEPSRVDAVLTTADGHIFAAGGARDAFLLGLEAGGTPNPAFGSAGAVVQSRSRPSATSVRTVLAEPDGELIVAATTNAGSTEGHPIWLRFTATGKPIRAANGAPYVKVPSVGRALIADGSHALFSVGYTASSTRFQSVTKYTRSGRVVATFGNRGVAPLPRYFTPSTAVIDRDGGVTVIGSLGRTAASGGGMGAYRLTAAGRPDRRFGLHGLAVIAFGGRGTARAYSGLALSGGRVLLVGRGDERLALAELGPDGRLARGFGRGGRLVCGCHVYPPQAAPVVGARGAFYVLAGLQPGRRGAGSVLVKVTAAGAIDRSFGTHGHLATQAGSPVALLKRGRQLIVVGTAGFRAVRAKLRAFGLDGTPRPSENGATVHAGALRGEEIEATVQPNGRLVLVGEQPVGEEEEAGHDLELLGLR
jgi:hypothetical protein